MAHAWVGLAADVFVAGNIDTNAVTAAANAGTMMAKMQETIPNSGGLISLFTGDNSMEDFGEEICSFGEYMVEFSEIISEGVDVKSVTSIVVCGPPGRF